MALIIKKINITLTVTGDEPEKQPGKVFGDTADFAPRALDITTRQKFEHLLGGNLDDVRIFTDPLASQALELLRADAAAIGPDIFIRQGQFDMETQAGQALLAHELTHVIQEKQGRGSDSDGGNIEAEALQKESQVRFGQGDKRRKKNTDTVAAGAGFRTAPDRMRQPRVHQASSDRSMFSGSEGIPSGPEGLLVRFNDGQTGIVGQDELKRAFLTAARMIEQKKNEFEQRSE